MKPNPIGILKRRWWEGEIRGLTGTGDAGDVDEDGDEAGGEGDEEAEAQGGLHWGSRSAGGGEATAKGMELSLAALKGRHFSQISSHNFFRLALLVIIKQRKG